jgi:hypothetical protein
VGDVVDVLTKVARQAASSGEPVIESMYGVHRTWQACWSGARKV